MVPSITPIECLNILRLLPFVLCVSLFAESSKLPIYQKRINMDKHLPSQAPSGFVFMLWKDVPEFDLAHLLDLLLPQEKILIKCKGSIVCWICIHHNVSHPLEIQLFSTVAQSLGILILKLLLWVRLVLKSLSSLFCCCHSAYLITVELLYNSF